MKAFAIDWRDLPTKELDYSRPVDFEQVFIRVQEDAHLIEPLPPSPAGELKPLTWIAQLGNPAWRPQIPWALIITFAVTLSALLAVLRGPR